MREIDSEDFLARSLNATCCGTRMQAAGGGILECGRCYCYLATSGGRVERTVRCGKHGGR